MSEVNAHVEVNGWGVLALLTLFAVIMGLYFHERGRAHANGLRADSLEAAVDTTRYEAGVWQRRLLQAEITRDSLDRLLKQRPAVRIVTVVQVDTVRETVEAPVTGDTIRRATFRLRQPPFTLGASVALPAPPATGTLTADIALDPLPLSLRIGCGEARGGIRPATASIEAPPWARISLDQVQGRPEVCNPQTTTRSTPWWAVLLGVGGGLLAGAAF